MEYASDGFEVPAVLLFIGAPIIPSRVEALLIPSIGETRDPLWAVLKQDKTSVCVCVCVCVKQQWSRWNLGEPTPLAVRKGLFSCEFLAQLQEFCLYVLSAQVSCLSARGA